MIEHGLSEEQRLMRQSCRDFVDEVVIPFIRGNWQREWSMVPEERLPPEILQGADKVGIRTLGVPEEFGGVELDKASEVATFALIAGMLPLALAIGAGSQMLQPLAIAVIGGILVSMVLSLIITPAIQYYLTRKHEVVNPSFPA